MARQEKRKWWLQKYPVYPKDMLPINPTYPRIESGSPRYIRMDFLKF
ncbi:hypothetical protein OOU_Y34scaffold00740g5 [Pyricularia oryzae Y34]|uniref:Uncharacterized protein n=1 Tax=Pyricularia oryzae (strain Y34) TaxID=1143189 RepID=A0AA97PHN6_PYRO3|nr:hypothetical protein OOU_Y34scaffold00740g5 [Pyricularia oryzae Y34]